MLNLQDILDELLDIEKKHVTSPTIRERFINFTKRREIEKQIQDENEADKAKVLNIGALSKAFLESRYWHELVEPHLRQSIKSSLQKIIREGESLTDTQLKSEIAGIRRMLSLIGMLKLKVAQAEDIKRAT